MPSYSYECTACGEQWSEILPIKDMNKPTELRCAQCLQYGTVQKKLTTPGFVSDSKSVLRRAGTEWQDVLKKVKKASGKGNTIHD
ncbi:MAG: hypothetical protein CBB72_011765 [Muricauda sp. TMED12]|nr:MAG: hypothetical protein CBB72_011765 [Muricauda sp. TMED12]